MKGIILFRSIHYVLSSEEILKNEGLTVKLIPVPREFSSNCGIALEFDSNDKETINRILKEKNIEIESIHEMRK